MFKHATSCRLHVKISTYGSAGQLCAVNPRSPVQVCQSRPLGDPGRLLTNRLHLYKVSRPETQSNTCASPVRGKKLTLAARVEHDRCTHCHVFVSFQIIPCIISVINVFSLFVCFYYTSLTVPVPMRRLQTVLLFSHSSHRFRRDSTAGVYVSGNGMSQDYAENTHIHMYPQTLRRKKT